ncbi:hypothetical protein PFISCL1PPCAC_11083, partial [Pristionchus fissidentatus]
RFRPEGGTYQPINEIKCENSQYVKYDSDGATPIAVDDDIDVRCVADAKYFCEYDLKYTKGKKALTRTEPVRTAAHPTKSGIECPQSHPFFVIRGQRPVIKPEEIICKNYYGKMRWTYKGKMLSSTSPEVHCVDKLECHVMNKIQKSNLQASFLNEQFLPTCQDGGKLTVTEGTEESDVIDVTCDGDTGVYNYTYRTNNGNLTRSVSKTTVFKCTYKVDLAPNAASNTWIVGVLVGSLIIGIAFASLVSWCMCRRKRQQAAAYNIGLTKHRADATQLSDRMEKNVELTKK